MTAPDAAGGAGGSRSGGAVNAGVGAPSLPSPACGGYGG